MSSSAPSAFDRPVSRRERRGLFLWGVVFLIVVTVLVIFLWARVHHAQTSERVRRVDASSLGPPVSVALAERLGGVRQVTLPGDVRGYNQTTLYAKITGYVRGVYVERGERVKQNQVLALLESPEYDQQVASATSQAEVKRANAERAEQLAGPGVVSAMERDNAVSAARVAEAELARLAAVKGYEAVRAPFDGIVTARYVDPGALVPAATGAMQSAQPVVDIADLDRARVFAYAGQDLAPFVHVGDPIVLWQDELPNARIEATVTRTANALDPRTRTMLIEIVLDNRTAGLKPGTYVHVRMNVNVPAYPTIPAEALVIRNGQKFVGIISNSTLHYQPIELGLHDGTNVRVTSGLNGGETIGISLPVELEDGAKVQPKLAKGLQVAPAAPPAPSSQAKPPPEGKKP